jgi:hypothetical protein
VTWQPEDRFEITDPLTGKPQPVVGLRLPYVSGVAGGGLTRILPNQWDMIGNLRTIPDSVEEFTCFYKHNDLLGGDFLGYGSLNHSKASGTAVVRNVRLPTWYKHGPIPDTRHLLATPEIRDWINNFDPARPLEGEPKFDVDSQNILWAADVWYSIKKHWVLELQRSIHARRSHDNGNR